jgi:hypothetical protein
LLSLLVKIGRPPQQFGSLVIGGKGRIMDDRAARKREIITKLYGLLRDRDTDIREAASLGLTKLAYYRA